MTGNKNVTFTQADLENFIGTENYYRSSPLLPGIFHTDGLHHIAENGCYWIIDLICSHQFNPKVKAAEFQVWEFIVNPEDQTCKATCTDGMNDYEANPLAVQEIPYADLPFNLSIWVELGSLDMINPAWVILLPSEH